MQYCVWGRADEYLSDRDRTSDESFYDGQFADDVYGTP